MYSFSTPKLWKNTILPLGGISRAAHRHGSQRLQKLFAFDADMWRSVLLKVSDDKGSFVAQDYKHNTMTRLCSTNRKRVFGSLRGNVCEARSAKEEEREMWAKPLQTIV